MLILKPFKPDDCKKIADWLKDRHTYDMLCADRYGAYPLSAQDICNYYSQNKNAFAYVAFDGGEAVGHILLLAISEDTVRLGSVVVDGEKRGRGYGKELLVQALKRTKEEFKARRVTIGVFEENVGAFTLYRALGFEVCGKREIIFSEKAHIYFELEAIIG